MRKRVSSDIAILTVGHPMHGHGGVAQAYDGAVVQRRALGRIAVDQDAVGRAEVLDGEAVALEAEARVLAADAGVVDLEVGLGAATDDQSRRVDRVAGTV